MRPLARACVYAALLFGVAHAADRVEIAGAGNFSCGKWIEARANQARTGSESWTAFMTTWMQGFLSGVNAMRIAMPDVKTIDIPDVATIRVLVDNACRADPVQNLAGAGIDLVVKLSAR